MKKWFYLILFISIVFVVMACQDETTPSEQNTPAIENTSPETNNQATQAPPLVPPAEGEAPNQTTLLRGLGQSVSQALDADLTYLSFYDKQGYILSGYYEQQFKDTIYLALYFQPPPPSTIEPVPDEDGEIFIDDEVVFPALVFYRLDDKTPYPLDLKFEAPRIEIDPTGWHDLNGDSVPDLLVFFSTATNSWDANTWRLFSINSEEAVVDLFSPLFSPTTAPIEFIDLNNNGKPIVKQIDVSWQGWAGLCPECSPRGYRLYAWHPDKKIYENNSAQFRETYQTDIDKYTQNLQSTFNQPLNIQTAFGPAISLLLAYDFSGRRAEGWEVFWQLTDPNNWPGSSADALNLLNNLRTMTLTQFETNQPFLPQQGL